MHKYTDVAHIDMMYAQIHIRGTHWQFRNESDMDVGFGPKVNQNVLKSDLKKPRIGTIWGKSDQRAKI